MAYKQSEIEAIFLEVIERIAKGEAVRNILKEKSMPDWSTFDRWLDKDEHKSIHYARAMRKRADNIFEDIIEICDSTENDIIIDSDGKEITNHNVIQRDRLRVDTRKWYLSKLEPKKYGDKSALEVSGKDGKDLNFSVEIIEGKNEGKN